MPGRFASRLLQAEAALLLCAARLLIEVVNFGRWRGLLGRTEPGRAGGRANEADGAPPSRADNHIARTVTRVADRLPTHFKCLPRAMAVHWMLARRGRRCALVLAILPGAERGTVDDLHAWVELGSDVLIGASDAPYHPLARFVARGRFPASG